MTGDDVPVVPAIPDEAMHDDVRLHLEPSDLGIEMPEDPEEATQLLLNEIAVARSEADEYLETVQRLAADFENYRKRMAREQVENVERASQQLLEHLLPSLDNFDAALAYEPQTEGEEKVLAGMQGTHQVLMETLAREGLEPVPSVGAPFDPEFHEAVSGPVGGDGGLVVTQELRRGYRLRGRVIRAALVTVDHA